MDEIGDDPGEEAQQRHHQHERHPAQAPAGQQRGQTLQVVMIAMQRTIGAGIAEPVIDQPERRQRPIQHRHRQHDAVRQSRETEHDGEEFLHRLPSWAVGGGRPFGTRRARPVDPRAGPHGRRAWVHPM